MAQSKTVTIFKAGGTASVQVPIIAGETPDQVYTAVASHLGLPANGEYRLLGPDNNQIIGDIFKRVSDGDKLSIAIVGEGGGRGAGLWIALQADLLTSALAREPGDAVRCRRRESGQQQAKRFERVYGLALRSVGGGSWA